VSGESGIGRTCLASSDENAQSIVTKSPGALVGVVERALHMKSPKWTQKGLDGGEQAQGHWPS
jgi:hypothetical protein